MQTLETSLGIIDVSDDILEQLKTYFSENLWFVQYMEQGKQSLKDTDLEGLVTTENHILMAKLQYQLLMWDLIEYLAKNGHPRPRSIRVLHAHGYSSDGEYQFVDIGADGSERWRDVGNWINQHDGNYGVLYVQSCNEANVSLKPKKSTLVYPTQIFSLKLSFMGGHGYDEGILKIERPKI